MPFLVGVHREDGSHPFFQGHGLDCVQEMGLEALDFYLNFRPPGVGGVGGGVVSCDKNPGVLPVSVARCRHRPNPRESTFLD